MSAPTQRASFARGALILLAAALLLVALSPLVSRAAVPSVQELVLAQRAPQRLAGEPLEPALEARVQALGKELRCAVCQGLSITDSPSSMARAQLEKVRELVSAGKSDEEVRQYFLNRYGEWVLLEPKVEGANLIVWLGPLVLIGVGGILILRQVTGEKRAPKSAVPETAAAAASTSVATASASASAEDEDPYLRAVRAELEK